MWSAARSRPAARRLNEPRHLSLRSVQQRKSVFYSRRTAHARKQGVVKSVNRVFRVLASFPCGTGSNRTAQPRRLGSASTATAEICCFTANLAVGRGRQDWFRHRNHNGYRSIQTGRGGPLALYKLLLCSHVLGVLQWLELVPHFQTTPQRLNWNIHKPRGRGRFGPGTIFTDSREAGRTKGTLKGPYTIKRARLVSIRHARRPASFLSPPGCYRGRSFTTRT